MELLNKFKEFFVKLFSFLGGSNSSSSFADGYDYDFYTRENYIEELIAEKISELEEERDTNIDVLNVEDMDFIDEESLGSNEFDFTPDFDEES